MKSSKDIRIFANAGECYPHVSPNPDLAYKPLENGISVALLNLSKEGNTEEVVFAQHMIAIYQGQSAYMDISVRGDQHQYPIERGSMGLIPPQTSIRCSWDKDVKFLYIYIEPNLLNNRADELYKGGKKVEIIPQLVPIKDCLIQQIGLTIQQELESTKCKIYLQSMTDALASHLLHHYSTHTKLYPQYQGGLSPYILKQVTDFINDNLEQNINLEELTKIANLSRAHFSRAFKKSLGVSPYQYIIQQRVERAKQLLIQGKMSIAEIAVACGFTHQSHLNRHFKSLTGVTPKFFGTQQHFCAKRA